MKNTCNFLLGLGLLTLAVGGCTGSGEQDRATTPATPQDSAQNTQEAPVKATAATTGVPDSQPKSGLANAVGRVLHNGKGVANIEVQMCGKVSMFSGCTGDSFEARTNADGYYLLEDVPPGKYGIVVRVFDSNSFVYPTTGILTSTKFNLEKGKTLTVRSVNLWKLDLKPLSPINGTTVSTDKPKLSWEKYPDAHNYKVLVSANKGSMSVPRMATGLTEVTPGKSLLNGEYRWKVEAYNVEGVKIAAMSDYSKFKVTGQKGSTSIETIAPANRATVAGDGLTLSWKPNPQADEYRVYVKGSGQKKAISSFESQTGTSKKIAQTLPAGKYYWTINAYKNRSRVSSSGIKHFTVK